MLWLEYRRNERNATEKKRKEDDFRRQLDEGVHRDREVRRPHLKRLWKGRCADFAIQILQPVLEIRKRYTQTLPRTEETGGADSQHAAGSPDGAHKPTPANQLVLQ